MSQMPPPPPPPPIAPPPPPPSFGPAGVSTSGQRAGFGPRLGAAIIDGLVSQAIAFVFSALNANLASVGSLIGLAIYCVMVGQGQSIGQKATGIRIVDATSGEGISAGKALGRRLVSIVSALPCFLGFFWMLWDKNKQTWHDKILSTAVVKA
jgi:uncharacterized RDD family membrane protein YckC